MKFIDCKIPAKEKVLKNVTDEIIQSCSENIFCFDKLNPFRVKDYIHILIEETCYNPKEDYFHDCLTGLRIDLKILKSVAVEYISEHIDDFMFEKYK